MDEKQKRKIIKPDKYLAAGASCVTFLLGISFLGRRSFWWDEAYSLHFAKMDWPHFWNLLSNYEANGALYYFLLKFWLLLGEDEFTLRLLSVIFATATIPVFYAIGKILFDRRIAVMASFLLGVNGFFIYYSQEARQYSLLLFLTNVSTYFFLKSVTQPSRRTWSCYVVFSVLSVYSHFFAFWVILVHALILPFLPKKKVDWTGALASALAIFLFLTPILVFIITRDVGQVFWISKTNLRSVEALLRAFSGWGKKGVAFANILFCVIALFYFVKAWLRQKASPKPWREVLVTAWFIFPIAAIFAISMFKPLFVHRYLIISLPPFILLIAAGICRFKNLWVVITLTAILSGFSMKDTIKSYQRIKKEDWRQTVELILPKLQPDDALIFIKTAARTPFEYYAQKSPFRKIPGYIYPAHIPLNERDEDLKISRPLNAAFFEELASQHKRVWVILSHSIFDPQTPMIKEWLADNFKRMEPLGERTHEIKVILYMN